MNNKNEINIIIDLNRDDNGEWVAQAFYLGYVSIAYDELASEALEMVVNDIADTLRGKESHSPE